ncbi:MAG: orotidine-5'-phosphate decarboxylase [Sphaerochaeta sp.]|jgi:orotidine-5'-phosphate decarboxylase|nr:orotidine-5'-phosphate decarboxylase [Sphaerochaeta sp.]MDX9914636.1 orotidine-5'-phosphate decarboxylase [Sphaerochaeta sp.]
MNWADHLRESAESAGNIVCMGLDPIAQALPIQGDDFYRSSTESFFALFTMMKRQGLSVAAFKPNLGYWQAEDRARSGIFDGSRALGDVLAMIEEHFPHTPVILDSKRGDIATSSHNYAREAFVSWQADAVTVAPYMGSDSVLPFIDFAEHGVYLLNRTSNPGGKDLQNLVLDDRRPLYLEVARQIAAYNGRRGQVGAVVGATNLTELSEIATFYKDERIPLLIPGVGSQGGSAGEVITILRQIGYPLPLVRINSSSGLTHPWKRGPAPDDWLARCEAAIASLIEEAAL